ncbi:MAG: cupin domain-containing protein [Firmicutes bacterium]|nr:cupin domain-containing protein [Bacillota bacterium]
MYYVARLDNSPFVETPLPEKRILRALISPELDPTNKDIALGMTQMTPGCNSDLRGHDEGELFFCLDGKGTVYIEGEEIELNKYEAVYVPPHHVHQLRSDRGEKFDILWALTPPFGGDRLVCDLARKAKETEEAK